MKAKASQMILIGGISFFIGLILILLSWNLSYPIHLSEIDEPTFTQFYPSIWPGVVLSLLGLFLVGYFSVRKGVKLACASFFPTVLYSYVFYFQYIPSSDSGNVRAMFEIFHLIGPDSTIEPYFQYQTYFNLNEITSQILGTHINVIAALFFVLYGILIGMYLFLFLSKNNINIRYQIAFIAVPLFFTAVFPFINYQWVPQTLALVFFLMMLVLFDKKGIKYRFLLVVIFIALTFTHAFIPVMFLMFFGLYSLKKREYFDVFLLLTWVYSMVLVYHTTAYFPKIIGSFKDIIFGFGEYGNVISRSLLEPQGFLNQIISMINRILIPLTWIVISVGSLMLFIKKKLSLDRIVLGLTGGFYLVIGFFYSILGTRGLQILCIPLVSGIEYFVTNWKKPFLIFVTIIIIFTVFSPMRSAYDNYFFQMDEDKETCNFLAEFIPSEQSNHLAVGHVNGDYFIKKDIYVNKGNDNYTYPTTFRPYSDEFYEIFHVEMGENEYVLYNPNLGKQMYANGVEYEEVYRIIQENLLNSKIYESGRSYIVTGE